MSSTPFSVTQSTVRTTFSQPRKTLLAAMIGGILAASVSFTVQADTQQHSVALAPSELAQTLNDVAIRWDVQISYEAELVQDLQAPALKGQYSLEQILDQLLQDKSLTWRYLNTNTLIIERDQSNHRQSSFQPEPDVETGTTIVSATRSPEHTLNLPDSVTVVNRKTIEALAPNSSNLGDLLSKAVPGLATSAESQSSYSQTLRGRQLTVLIDGVPQTGSLRGSSRELVIMDPSMVERIEVLRGPTGIYGYGATGGLINIITRSPGEGELSFSSELSSRFSMDSSDSLSWRAFQQVSGKTDKIRYIASASYETMGLYYDAEGDAIPVDPHGQGGVADARNYDIYLKAARDLSESETLTFSLNKSRIKQDNDYRTNNGIYGSVAASLAEGGVANAQGYETENQSINLQYEHDDLWQGELNAQLYSQQGHAVNKYNSKLAGQSVTDSDKMGLRISHRVPLSTLDQGSVVWGMDITREEADQHFTDGRAWTPEMQQDSYAPFANLKFNLAEQLIARIGARYDYFKLDVDNFTATNGNAVTGGQLNYDELTYNAGLTWLLDDQRSLYLSFSQGYSIPDIGRIMRGGNASLKQLNPEAQKVDNYELGFKADWDQVQHTLAVFYNESDLGLRFAGDANGTNYAPKRSPEQLYGLEATLDWQPDAQWQTGTTLTWSEGKLDSDDNGSYDRWLGGERIPPIKLTAYLSHQTGDRWQNRLDLLYSGNRDRFRSENEAADASSSDSLKRQYAHGKVDSFMLWDLTTSYRLQGNAGKVHLGISNLLNEDYYTVESQFRNRDAQYTRGRGRTFTLGYSMDW